MAMDSGSWTSSFSAADVSSVGYRDGDFEEERLALVTSACKAISEQGKTRIVPVFVDARPKKSASKA